MASAENEEITIEAGGVELGGSLSIPPSPKGLVLFAHGSGSSRFSPRNRHVAGTLRQHGLATLLFDLLTRDEERFDDATAELRFDIRMLARRLVEVTDWTVASHRTRGLPVGYFGSSTGAAAALVAAAERPRVVDAIVSRGGRPDLAADALPRVTAPTLLVVGGEDVVVIQLNERAYERLRAPRRVVIVGGATHLFEEPGALDTVARLAAEWFLDHLGKPRPVTASGAADADTR